MTKQLKPNKRRMTIAAGLALLIAGAMLIPALKQRFTGRSFMSGEMSPAKTFSGTLHTSTTRPTAQIGPRSEIPISLGASGPIGHSYYADRAQGLRYYREAYSAECFNADKGFILCMAGVSDGEDEEPFFRNPEWTWS